MADLDDAERAFIRHALGLNYERVGYRNFYMAGGDDAAVGRGLVAKGMAIECAPHPELRPDPCFMITRAGFDAAKATGESMDREETQRMHRLAPLLAAGV
jgi:hypothetical protein